jgi:hypothetical protein
MFTGMEPQYTTFLILMMLWSLPWKGIAMWKAARNNSRTWFIVLLVVNTVGLLDIAYIFFFANKKQQQPVNENKPDDNNFIS